MDPNYSTIAHAKSPRIETIEAPIIYYEDENGFMGRGKNYRPPRMPKIHIIFNKDKRCRYKWSVRWRDFDGKYRRRSFPTQDFADRFISYLQEEFFAHIIGQDSRPIINLVNEFLGEKELKVSDYTYKQYKSVLSKFCYSFGDPPFSSFRKGSLAKFKREVRQIKYHTSRASDATVLKYFRVLKVFFRWAVDKQYMSYERYNQEIADYYDICIAPIGKPKVNLDEIRTAINKLPLIDPRSH